jgi:AraC family transcriptional regulator, transcriptional activator of pobA
MNKELIKSEIKTNVYHITFESDVILHKHHNYDEIFYCLEGTGYGVLENIEKKLEAGDEFIVKENAMHSLRSDSDMWVASILIPCIKESTK